MKFLTFGEVQVHAECSKFEMELLSLGFQKCQVLLHKIGECERAGDQFKMRPPVSR